MPRMDHVCHTQQNVKSKITHIQTDHPAKYTVVRHDGKWGSTHSQASNTVGTAYKWAFNIKPKRNKMKDSVPRSKRPFPGLSSHLRHIEN